MRLLILLRNAKNELARLIHPRAVFPVKINRQTVDPLTISAVTTFTLLFLICGFVGWVLLMMMGVELTDAFGVVIPAWKCRRGFRTLRTCLFMERTS